MLAAIGLLEMEDLVEQTVPSSIRLTHALQIGKECDEYSVLAELRALASENKIYRSFIGMGYHDCITPIVIQRNT